MVFVHVPSLSKSLSLPHFPATEMAKARDQLGAGGSCNLCDKTHPSCKMRAEFPCPPFFPSRTGRKGDSGPDACQEPSRGWPFQLFPQIPANLKEWEWTGTWWGGRAGRERAWRVFCCAVESEMLIFMKITKRTMRLAT